MYNKSKIAVINQKGGVGKTTTVINLAASLSILGQNNLIIDLDPQGNATTGLGKSNSDEDRNIYNLLIKKKNLEEVIYECYAPGGVAVFIKTLTDNKNRTVSEIRHAFTKYGGNLGTSGSVAYLFEAKGKVLVDADLTNEALYDIAAENGADDINELDESKTELVCDPKDLSNLKEKLELGNFKVEASEIVMETETNISLDAEQSEKNIKLTDAIEDLDDVQEVFTNADLDQSVFTS